MVENKIRSALCGLRGNDSVAELYCKEGIGMSLYYTWSKELIEAGKRRLAGDTAVPLLKHLRRKPGMQTTPNSASAR